VILLKFECKLKNDNGKIEKWFGEIVSLINYGSHFEMNIQSRSNILVLFGKSKSGNFACIPDWSGGCHLVNYNDLFWNTEKLTQAIGEVDGITVAYALKTVAPLLNS
jgi:hypothetical protein